MHTMSEALRAHVAGGGRLFRCIRITRKDAAVIRLCDALTPLTVAGETYAPCPHGSRDSAVSATDNTGESLLETVFDETLIDRNDVRKGLYDRAEIEIRYAAPPPSGESPVLLFTGSIGTIRYDKDVLHAELIPAGDLRRTNIVSRYSPYCRAVFGDSACGIDKDAMKVSVSAAKNMSGAAITLTAVPENHAFFTCGSCTCTDGANAGFTAAIAGINNGVLTLKEAPPFAVAAGATLDLLPGCDKRFSTCVNRYENAVNFRGEPHLPGAAPLV